MSETYSFGPFQLQKLPVIGQHLRLDPQYRCAACHEPFKIGDTHTLVPVGPGNNAEARAKARAGQQPDPVAAVPVHWACATGEE
jgi:hypothetical protein